LGVPLIVRSRYGVHFTPEGEEVRKKTEEAAGILRRMREVLDGQRDEICGTIHIGVSVNYALYRFPETLSLYRKKYPQVNTHIITDHSRKLILQALNGEVDVAILRGEFQWSGKKNTSDQGESLRHCLGSGQGKTIPRLTIHLAFDGFVL